VGVLVWYFFIASAQDNRSVEDMISDMESGGAHARSQDAYALALKANDLSSKGECFSEESTRKLVVLLERLKGEESLCEFLTLAVGRAGTPDIAIPLMTKTALLPETPPKARLNAVYALGLSGSARAVEPFKEVIDRYPGSEEWRLRWLALAGLSQLREKSAIPYLRKALGDPRKELSWGAACWLANFFSDSGGVETLRKLMDWSYLDGERGDQNQELLPAEKERFMVMALQGLYELEKDNVLGLVEEKCKDSRSFKVQNAAREILGKRAAEKKAGKENAESPG
jgi:HEAT repeat protein